MSAKFVKPKQAEAVFGVHRRTLRKWADEGHIKSMRPGGCGQTLYDISTAITAVADTHNNTAASNTTFAESNVDQTECVDVVYARVSTRK